MFIQTPSDQNAVSMTRAVETTENKFHQRLYVSA